MRRSLFLFLSLLLMTLSTAAQARKARLPIPIPSFSKSETLVKVRDLPKAAPFIDQDGHQIDLGYFWSASGQGQWVGYISETRYVKWTPQMVDLVVAISGMKSLPPVPEREADLSAVGGWGGLFWGFLVIVGIAAWLRKRQRPKDEPADAVTAAPVEIIAASPVRHAAPTFRNEPRRQFGQAATRASFGRR